MMAKEARLKRIFRTVLVMSTVLIPLTKTTVNAEEINYGVMYGILLDAGSTSTKLNVYRWEEANSVNGVPFVHLIKRERFKPGLHTVSANPQDIEPYLTKILNEAKTLVPDELQADTPIYVMATAGLRYLTKVDSKAVLQAVRGVLGQRNLNPFSFAPDQVQVLSGEREGAYAWAALNYLTRKLSYTSPVNDTYGILEMGGGSTQIAFLPKYPLYQEEFQIRVFGQLYRLYAQSYLHFGADSINLRVYSKLKSEPGTTQENPCMLRGDVKNVTIGNSSSVVTYEGTGRPSECKEILTRLLRPAEGIACSPKPCAIGRVYQPRVDNMEFYASQGFIYTPKTLGVLSAKGRVNITQLQIEAEKHCRRTINEAISLGMKANFASQDCLMGLYIPTLLTMSYGFSPTANINFSSSIGEQRIDWSLGAILVELSDRETQRQNEGLRLKAARAGPHNKASVIRGSLHYALPSFIFVVLINYCSSHRS